ncbi:MAG: TonB-dependent receptor [Bacteroidota bacterium]|nr:TonB-dependent receptor [Bacteroidota bacterium]
MSGRIIDQKTNEPIEGVSIYIPELSTGTISGNDGSFKIEKLPPINVLIQMSCIGYKSKIEKVDLSSQKKLDISLEQAIIEMNKVVVTGMSQLSTYNKAPAALTLISKEQLQERPATNLIDAIANQPGISQITTGGSISKPVIRGMGYNRVIVINDGIRQEGQQWGDEHGIEIDENAVNHVEILKGPASLSFGSDALAGVINLIPDAVLPSGSVKGNLIGNYQTNNGLIGGSLDVAGNNDGFNWSLRESVKQAHAYQNRNDGYVYGSGFKESSLSGSLGLNRMWGYSRLIFSIYHLKPGIVEGERDSLTGKFVKEFAPDQITVGSQLVTPAELKSYSIGIPYQQIHHYKLGWISNVLIGSNSLKTIFGYQQNQRQEYANVLNPSKYGLYFKLHTFTYDTRWAFPHEGLIITTMGINGMFQASKNEGSEFIVPEYRLFDFGTYLISQVNWDKFGLNGGIRYDRRTINSSDLYVNQQGEKTVVADPDVVKRFSRFNSSFSNVTGSIGCTYQFSDALNTKLNISKGFRAPNIAELGANGVHEGTMRYEIGNPSMKAENSLQVDYGLRYSSYHVSAEISCFYNQVNHFIYAKKLETISGKDSIIDRENNFPAFKFTQGNARLYGCEISVDIHPHPLDWLHFENSFSFVRAIQKNATDSTRNLPFMPAPKLTSELKATSLKLSKQFNDMFFSVGIEQYFKQTKIFSAYGTEIPTSGYALVNLGLGGDWISNKKKVCTLVLNVQNLTDVVWQSHLSRLKYAPVNYATGNRGVFNMGRNISLKLLIPIDIK